eukprot:6062879-Amphidinium_carterae.1
MDRSRRDGSLLFRSAAFTFSMRLRICLPSVQDKLAIIPPFSSMMHTRPRSVLDAASKGLCTCAALPCTRTATPSALL